MKANGSQSRSGSYNAERPQGENGHTPALYDFKDWQSFKVDTMRYHNIAFPHRNMIMDRAATFRSFMSDEVIRFLNQRDPRIFNANESDFSSWSEWINTVTTLLRVRDDTIPGLVENPFETPAESWSRLYKNGTISERDFWKELSDMVSKEVITAAEQRRLFWDSHSWAEQRQLVDRCPYFDPSDRVWDMNTDYASRVLAERLIDEYMKSKIEIQVAQSQRILYTHSLLFIFCTILLIIMFSLLAAPNVSVEYNRAAYIAFVIIGTLASIVAFTFFITMLPVITVLRRVKKAQRAYHLGQRPKGGSVDTPDALADETNRLRRLAASTNTVF